MPILDIKESEVSSEVFVAIVAINNQPEQNSELKSFKLFLKISSNSFSPVLFGPWLALSYFAAFQAINLISKSFR